jgi:HlyD family secretion protein
LKVSAWLWTGTGAAALGALALWLGAPLVLGKSVVAAPVVRQEIVQTVVASGQVQTPFRVNIASQVIGAVKSVPVDEGQAVKAGDLLILLDNVELTANVQLAEAGLAEAEAKIRQLRDVMLPAAQQSLQQAQATLLDAQQIFDRADKLLATGAATKAKVDSARTALDIALSQVRNARIQEQSNQPDGISSVLAQTQANQARASLATAKARLDYAQIRAPVAGTLISRAVERGYVVSPGATLMVLSPVGAIQIVVQIDEKDLGLIALGQPAKVSADAYPNTNFPASVVYINPSIDLQRGSVEIKLAVPDPPATLRQDMTVSVDIEVARRKDALTVKTICVHDGLTRTPWLLIARSGRAVRQSVMIGARGILDLEIDSGAAAGDLVIPASAAIAPGDKVRVAAP